MESGWQIRCRDVNKRVRTKEKSLFYIKISLINITITGFILVRATI